MKARWKLYQGIWHVCIDEQPGDVAIPLPGQRHTIIAVTSGRKTEVILKTSVWANTVSSIWTFRFAEKGRAPSTALGFADNPGSAREDGPGIAALDLKMPTPDLTVWVLDEDLLCDDVDDK